MDQAIGALAHAGGQGEIMKTASKTIGTVLASVGALALLLSPGTAPAQAEPDPEKAQALVEDVTDRVMAVLDEFAASDDMDVEDAADQINGIALEHLDFVTMTKLAVGRYWRDASRDEKRTLVTEFRDLLIRTYTQSLDQYSRGHEVEFLPMRPSPYEDRVTVRSRVIRPDGPAIPVEYSLLYRDGEWFVYDIVVEGISLVTTYRSTFANAIQRDGIDGLIRDLEQKNAAGETAEEITP